MENDDGEKVTASPEMSDLQLFAKLLAEGYQHGMKANQPIIDSAMQFVDRQGQRVAKQEQEIERLRAVIHKQNLQIAELSSLPAPAGEESVLGALAAGMLQASQGQQGQQGLQPPAGVSQIQKRRDK
jgi:hypothetical protein